MLVPSFLTRVAMPMPKKSLLTVFTVSLLAASVVLPAAPCFAQNMQNFNRSDDEPQPLVAAPPVQAAPVAAPIVPQATDLQMRMNALETLVRNMTGQMEKLQFQNNQMQQLLQRMGGDSDVRFRDIEGKQAAFDNALKALALQQQTQSAPAPAAPAPAAPATAETTPAPAAAPETKTEAKPETPESGVNKPTAPKDAVLGTIKKDGEGKGKADEGDAQVQYDTAFQALRQAKYDDAERSFKTFLEGHPKHRLTENAKYWLAETYYVRGKFEEAAVAFAEAYEQFPKGAKAPDNLLKLAMSLGSLGKKQDACLTLGELTKRFPQASAVTRNRTEQQRKSLGCS